VGAAARSCRPKHEILARLKSQKQLIRAAPCFFCACVGMPLATSKPSAKSMCVLLSCSLLSDFELGASSFEFDCNCKPLSCKKREPGSESDEGLSAKLHQLPVLSQWLVLLVHSAGAGSERREARGERREARAGDTRPGRTPPQPLASFERLQPESA
jgi:hypothetical protein